MIDLSPFVQDVIATGLATAAFGVLLYRTVAALRPAAGEAPCTTCSACPKPASEPEAALKVIPVNNLRRHGGSSEQPTPGIRLIG